MHSRGGEYYYYRYYYRMLYRYMRRSTRDLEVLKSTGTGIRLPLSSESNPVLILPKS